MARVSGEVSSRTKRGTMAAAALFGSPTRVADAAGGYRREAGAGMKVGALVSPLVHAVRDLDTRWHRRQWPQVRNIVFDARTAMEYAMMAPVHRRLLAD